MGRYSVVKAGGRTPEEDPLFYACFDCPRAKENPPKDCNWNSSCGECVFRVKWGVAKGIIEKREANLLFEKHEKLRRMRWKQTRTHNVSP